MKRNTPMKRSGFKPKPARAAGTCTCGKPSAPSKRYCAPCHAAYMREWRKTNPLEGEARERQIARAYARVYEQRGKLVRQACEACGDDRAERHHDDYSKPLQIRWLCRPCHLAHHADELAADVSVNPRDVSRVTHASMLRIDDGNARATVPVPKRTYTRSEPLKAAYRSIPCQHCGLDDGTCVGAHSNHAIHGKGRGLKASDEFAATLCRACHFHLDQGRVWSKAEKQAVWWAAHQKTIRVLIELKRWPAGVPVPDVEQCPW